MRRSGRRHCICFAGAAAVLIRLAAIIGIVAMVPTVTAAAEATAVRVSGDAKATEFELQLAQGVTAEVFTLANPYRVIVDLPDVSFNLPEPAGHKAQGLVKAFRYGLFAERKARVVIDTKGPVRVAKAYMDRVKGTSGVLLKIRIEPMEAAAFGSGTGASRSAEPPPSAASPTPPSKKDVNHAKPVIVIDPGHGGIDPGAAGVNNMAEKTIVLEVAQKLADTLAATGRYAVKLTRSSDVFVSLDERLSFSQKAGADLFVSLHADAIEERVFAESVRGATVYTLSERATDEQARKMAEKENASDLLAGLDSAELKADDQVRGILFDLLRRETANFSADFSNVLAKRLGKTIAMSRVPQRSAAFKVLKQPHSPSVLIELGYMSNTEDQRQMATAEWQTSVAAAIMAAIDTYFTKRTAEHP